MDDWSKRKAALDSMSQGLYDYSSKTAKEREDELQRDQGVGALVYSFSFVFTLTLTEKQLCF